MFVVAKFICCVSTKQNTIDDLQMALSEWAKVINFLNIEYFFIVLSMIIHSNVGV